MEQFKSSFFSRFNRNLGIGGTFFITLGYFLGAFYLPATSISLIFGALLLMLYFLFATFDKDHFGFSWPSRIFSLLSSLFMITSVFKWMYWPGADSFFISPFGRFAWLPVSVFLLYVVYKKGGVLNTLIPIAALIVSFATSMSRNNFAWLQHNYIAIAEGARDKGKQLDEINSQLFSANAENQKAQNIKKSSDEIYSYCNNLLGTLIKETTQNDTTSALKDYYFAGADLRNYDVTTHILIGDDEANPQSGPNSAKELRVKLNEYQKTISKNFMGKENEEMLKISYLTNDSFYNVYNDGIKETWETYYFYHRPLAGIIAYLNQTMCNIRYIENIALNKVISQQKNDKP